MLWIKKRGRKCSANKTDECKRNEELHSRMIHLLITVCLLLPYKVMWHGCRQTWDKEAQRPSLRWKYLSVFIALTVSYSFLTLKKRTVKLRFNEPIYNEVLDITNILVVFSKICLIEMLDITNPRYNEQISQSLGTSLNRGSTVCQYCIICQKEQVFFFLRRIICIV